VATSVSAGCSLGIAANEQRLPRRFDPAASRQPASWPYRSTPADTIDWTFQPIAALLTTSP